MGEILTKNPCVNLEDTILAPRYHFKCRYADNDEYCITPVYTRTKDTLRYHVPRNKIKWTAEYENYQPFPFTSEKILLKDGKTFKDPHIDDEAFKSIRFNEIDTVYNCDRKSHHGPYELHSYSQNNKTKVPRNPVGRTGLIGRGHLGRWGPNHAADPIVTTWKRDQNGNVLKSPKTGLGVLQFVAIQRRDTKEWAIPGGMRDPGEVITKTLVREFTEEALNMNSDIKFDKFGKIISKTGDYEKKLNEFFKNGTLIYKGYVDDPRNTDNSWMETIACNFHDDTGYVVGGFKLQGGDDAEHATWLELNSSLKLFASHVDFLRQVASMHNANW